MKHRHVLVCVGMLLSIAAIVALPALHEAALAQQEPAGGRQCGSCHVDNNPDTGPQMQYQGQGQAHAGTGCTDCHVGMSVPHQGAIKAVDCTTCHQEAAEGFSNGLHGLLARRNDLAAPTCASCHGAHGVASIPDTPTTESRMDMADSCAECHPDAYEQHTASIHGRALLNPDTADWAPTCITCHGAHDISGVHAQGAPTASSQLPATCGGCHQDEAFAEKMGIPKDRLSTYRDTKHGVRNRFGSERAATCEDCHGHHQILPQDNPMSTISSENIIDTCGQCHENANENFVASRIHISADPESSPGVFFARWFYIIIIVLFVGGFVLHIIFDLIKKKREKEAENA